MGYGSGFAFFLLGKYVLLGGVPVLAILIAWRSVREERRTGSGRLALSGYLAHLVKGFLYASLIILTIGLLLGVLLIIIEP